MAQADGSGASLFDAVGEFVAAHGLFRGVRRVLVACSGGGDSTALLDVLDRGAEEWGLELAVAHLDHGWRGREAAADAHHVGELAEARGLRLFVERLADGPDGGEGVPEDVSEASAREARHRFFARVSDDWGADAVALGHTADDRAETTLLNLVRGSGRTGLAAMRPRRLVEGLLLLRPLLGQRRDAVRAYCLDRELQWREDASNRMERFARVRLRRHLLPVLEAQFPGAVERLARTAALIADEEEWLSRMAREELERLQVPEPYPGGIALEAGALRELPRPLARRVLRAAVRRVRGDLSDIAMVHADAVLDDVLAGSDNARDLPGVRVRREGGSLRLLPLEGRRLRPPGGG